MEIGVKERLKRFNRFYGDVQRVQNERIINKISGKKILDIGCGYGFLVKQLNETPRFESVAGIDNDEESVKVCNELFPHLDVKKADIYDRDFQENQFETIIFREAIHHLEVDKALGIAKNLKVKEIIIFDPNPNFIVKMSRKLIKHEDERVNVDMLIEACKRNEMKIEEIEYSDVIAFPCSGGLVGKEICPNVGWIKKFVLFLDNTINKLLKILKIQKHFCWRYCVKIKPY